MPNLARNLESIAESIFYSAKAPTINPTLDRATALLTAIRQISERELTDRQRTAFTLCFFEEMTVTQAAELMKLNKSTVSRHLSAAKRRIVNSLRYSFFPIWRGNG